MTQKELADAISVNVSIISKYESGVVTPSITRLEALASALNVEVGFLMEELNFKGVTHRNRDEDFTMNLPIHRILILGAGGHCELCHAKAPFLDTDGRPYLDIRFVDPDNKELDPLKNAVALYPNCSRRIEITNDPKDIFEIERIASEHNY